MYEKVNPSHPDKVADRIAGALVDLAYAKESDPRIAAEVLIGHGKCLVILESSVRITEKETAEIVARIAGKNIQTELLFNMQDAHLADNQKNGIRCGDNGIFKGVPVTQEQKTLSAFARSLYEKYPTDGKFILAGSKLIVCQSNASEDALRMFCRNYPEITELIINPLGEWTGGTDVDTGATNRKLGSDMADSVTGGGLCGKDLSKADVSVNIYAWQKAQASQMPVELHCAIGDDIVDSRPYAEIVAIAREYIRGVGGFEKFAEWGLV